MSIIEHKKITLIRKNGPIPDLPFLKIKDKILGKNYSLSIVFCTSKESRLRNKIYRDKDYPTNILSFPLSELEGEIYITLQLVRSEAKKFDMSYKKFLHFIVIHGMLHLKGYDHSSTMDKLENTYLNQFFRGT